MKKWLMWLCLAGLTWAQPAPPLKPPPPCPNQSTNPSQAWVGQSFALHSGWNAVSFPFARVEGWQDWPSLLVDPQGGSLTPGQTKLGQGYWVYSAEACEAKAWGALLENPTSLTLEKGWNLLGNPYFDPISLAQASWSDGTDHSRTWEERQGNWFASQSPVDPLQQWLPGIAYWVETYRPLSLQLNLPNQAPQVSRASKAGESLLLEGSNFGPAESGRLTLGNQTLPVSEWTPTRIRTPLPKEPGSVAVLSGGAVSKRVYYEKRDPQVGSSHLRLTVLGEDGAPLAGVKVNLAGREAKSDSWGVARFYNLAPGNYSVRVSGKDFVARQAQIEVPAGRNLTQRTTLYSPRSSAWIKAYPCDGDWRPVRVELYPRADYSQRQIWTFYYEQASPFIEVTWNDIKSNLVYNIDITWRNSQQVERMARFERRISRFGLQESFWNYWSIY